MGKRPNMENVIGYYQLDNLIRGRIPCLLLMIGVDLKSWYGPLEKMHLNTWAIDFETDCDIETVFLKIEERQAPKDFGVVVLCKDGDHSKHLLELLIQKGHTNTYWIEGGFTALEKEKASL